MRHRDAQLLSSRIRAACCKTRQRCLYCSRRRVGCQSKVECGGVPTYLRRSGAGESALCDASSARDRAAASGDAVMRERPNCGTRLASLQQRKICSRSFLDVFQNPIACAPIPTARKPRAESMAHGPLTTGPADRGAGGYRFTGYTP